MQMRGYHDFRSEIFVPQYRKKLLEQFGVSENFEYRKKILQRGISQFYVENLLFHSHKKLRRRTLLCFKKNLVSKNFMHNRSGIMVLSTSFCLTGPKNFVRVPFVFQILSNMETNMDMRWGYHIFPLKFSVSQCR